MKVVIAGFGNMGKKHLEGWQKCGASITGIVGSSRSQMEETAERFGVNVFPTLEEALKNADIIDICSPTPSHYPIARQALEANLSVFCEKPVTRHTNEAIELANLAVRKNLLFMPAHVVRFFPEYRQARESVKGGEIGTPSVFRFSRESFCPKKKNGNWFNNTEESGGVIMDMMIHDMDYARWLGGDVDTIYTKSIRSENNDSPIDYGLTLMHHKSGLLTHLCASWAYPPPRFRTSFELAGSKGLICHDSEETAPVSWHLQPSKESSASPDVPQPGNVESDDPYTLEIRAFCKAFNEGGSPPVTIEDGVRAVEMACAAITSAKTGKAVTI